MMRYCSHPALLLPSSILFVLLLLPRPADAQTVPLQVDHRTNEVTLRGEALAPDSTIYLRKREKLQVKVINTNSALHTYSVSSEAEAVDEVKQIQAFLGSIGPYLIDIPSVSIYEGEEPNRFHALSQSFELHSPSSLSSDIDLYAPFLAFNAEEVVPPFSPIMIYRSLIRELEIIRPLLADWQEQHGRLAALTEHPRAVEQALDELRAYLLTGHASSQLLGLHQIQLRTLTALDSMQVLKGLGRDTPQAIERIRGRLRASLHSSFVSEPSKSSCASARMYRLKHIPPILATIHHLDTLLQESPSPEQVVAQANRTIDDLNRLAEQIAPRVARTSSLLASLEAVEEGSELVQPAEFKALRLEIETLETATAHPPSEIEVDTYNKLVARAETALKDADRILQFAYATEGLAARVLNARTTWCAPALVNVSAHAGKKMTLRISSASPSALGRLTDSQRLEANFHVRRDWLARPSVGLVFTAAPKARFSTYGSQETQTPAGSDTLVVAETGVEDRRFTLNLSFALTWRFLDWRHHNSSPQTLPGKWRMAVWIPELLINPSTDIKAIGIGSGISFGITRRTHLKFSAGLLYAKHKELIDRSVGDYVPNANAMETRSTYGFFTDPQFYWGITLTGWPPFLHTKQ